MKKALKIVVLAKQVPDTRNVGKDAMTAEGTVNRAALPAIFNPEDLNALEQALRLKEQNPGSTVGILTMGPPRAGEIIRQGLYRGADTGWLLTDRLFAGADTLATSYALATGIQKIGDVDIVIDGVNADTSKTGESTVTVGEGANVDLTVKDSTLTTGGSLTIKDTTTGMVIAGGSDEKDSSVTITDGADVTIQDTHVSGSTQSGRGVTQHGDLTLDGGSSLTIDGSHVGEDDKTHENGGIGIASWNDIIVKAKSKLNIKNTQTGIYGHQGASTSLTTENSTLNITNSDAGIRYEGSGTAKDGSKLEAAGDITFKDSDVTIEGKSLGIETGNNSDTTVTFDHTTAAVSAAIAQPPFRVLLQA